MSDKERGVDLLDLGPYPPGFILASLHQQRLESDFEDGIAAAVEMYYTNYTGADHLEDDFLSTLRRLEEFVTLLDTDMDEIIRGAEQKVRDTGRRVRTINEEDGE